MIRPSPWVTWAWLALAGLIVLILLGGAVGLRWDPLGLGARRLAHAQERAVRAENETAARRLETQGAREAARRLDLHHQQGLAIERATAAARSRAENAHDAHQSLDPDRARRLGEHDRELCSLSSHLVGCAAAP